MKVELRPQFIEGTAGKLFFLLYASVGSEPGSTRALFVPPFGEELNKSRRMFHLQARSLAEAGITCGLVDLYGTGDSAGEFADATWSQWLGDVAVAHDFLRASGAMEIIHVGLRMGALLALEHTTAAARPQRMVLWHPWLDGRAELDNLLRMRVVADKFSRGVETSVAGIRAGLAVGQSAEVAGYEISSRLAAEIDAKRLDGLIRSTGPEILWLDVGAEEGAALSPARSKLARGLPETRLADIRVVRGDRFWGTAEIATCPSLITATTEYIARR